MISKTDEKPRLPPQHSAPRDFTAMPPKAKPKCMYEGCDASAVHVCIARCGCELSDEHGSLIDPEYGEDSGGKWYQKCNACVAAECQHCGGGEGLGIPCSYSLINGNNKCEDCARRKRVSPYLFVPPSFPPPSLPRSPSLLFGLSSREKKAQEEGSQEEDRAQSQGCAQAQGVREEAHRCVGGANTYERTTCIDTT